MILLLSVLSLMGAVYAHRLAFKLGVKKSFLSCGNAKVEFVKGNRDQMTYEFFKPPCSDRFHDQGLKPLKGISKGGNAFWESA